MDTRLDQDPRCPPQAQECREILETVRMQTKAFCKCILCPMDSVQESAARAEEPWFSRFVSLVWPHTHHHITQSPSILESSSLSHLPTIHVCLQDSSTECLTHSTNSLPPTTKKRSLCSTSVAPAECPWNRWVTCCVRAARTRRWRKSAIWRRAWAETSTLMRSRVC